MIVRQILKSKGTTVLSVPNNEAVAQVATVLREMNVGAVAVLDEQRHLAGIVSERDIVWAIAEHGVAALDWPASALMTQDLVTCSPGDHTDALMHVVTEQRVRHLPVLEHGHLAGIISIGDLVKARIGELESEGEAMRTYIAAAG